MDIVILLALRSIYCGPTTIQGAVGVSANSGQRAFSFQVYSSGTTHVANVQKEHFQDINHQRFSPINADLLRIHAML